MAGDFYAAFGLGEDSHYINNIDADGIALAAIQGLYRRLQDKEAQIEAQQREIDDLEQRLITLEKDQEGQRSNVLPITIWIGLIILVIPTAKTFFARLRL